MRSIYARDAEAVWAGFTAKYDTKIIQEPSLTMKMYLMSLGLGKLRKRLENTGFTLGRLIYVPFRIGEAEPLTSVLLCIHEHVHVARAGKYGRFKWYVRYAFDRRFRALEEAMAYFTALELITWLRGSAMGLSITPIMGKLKEYRLGKHIAEAESYLRMRFHSLQSWDVVRVMQTQTTEAMEIIKCHE